MAQCSNALMCVNLHMYAVDVYDANASMKICLSKGAQCPEAADSYQSKCSGLPLVLVTKVKLSCWSRRLLRQCSAALLMIMSERTCVLQTFRPVHNHCHCTVWYSCMHVMETHLSDSYMCHSTSHSTSHSTTIESNRQLCYEHCRAVPVRG